MSHALRFLVVVVKIAPSVARLRKGVKKISRSTTSAKARHQVFHKVMCWIATQIQRNSGWSFLCIFFDERGIAKSVVTNISMKNFFSECVQENVS